MAVPEATVHENYFLTANKHDVRLARQASTMETIAIPCPV